MIDLTEIQNQLKVWQKKNFGANEHDNFRMCLGMAEEVGEVCHQVLKLDQGIRGGTAGYTEEAKQKIAADVIDIFVFGMQLLSWYDIDVEDILKSTVAEVLARDWKANPSGEGFGEPIQSKKVMCEAAYQCNQMTCGCINPHEPGSCTKLKIDINCPFPGLLCVKHHKENK